MESLQATGYANTAIHMEAIQQARIAMPGQEELSEMADVFKAFGDGTRIRILFALCGAELCVCDIACLLNMSLSCISHQLRLLKQSELVKSRRQGKTVFYSLDDTHIKTIFDQMLLYTREIRR